MPATDRQRELAELAARLGSDAAAAKVAGTSRQAVTHARRRHEQRAQDDRLARMERKLDSLTGSVAILQRKVDALHGVRGSRRRKAA